jgi:hypothetical protein
MSVSQLRSLAKAARLPESVLASVVTVVAFALLLPSEYASPQVLFRDPLPARSVELVACSLSLCFYRPLSFRVWDTVTLRSPPRIRFGVRCCTMFLALASVTLYMLLAGQFDRFELLIAAWRSCLVYSLLACVAADLPGLGSAGPALPTGYFVLTSFFAVDHRGNISLLAFTRDGIHDVATWVPVVLLLLVTMYLTHLPAFSPPAVDAHD